MQAATIEWEDVSYRTDEGVLVTAWGSPDDRFKIEQHPMIPDKFLLTDRGRFAGIYPKFEIAEHAALGRMW